MEQITQKLSARYKVGYGLWTAADGIPYNLFYIYFLFYLTDVVHVSAGIAGTIALLAIVVDALKDPLVGRLSDDYVSEKGRRMPWMKASLIPLCAVVYMMFAPIEIVNPSATFVFYVVMALLMWVFYSTFFIPYNAMGAEITDDYGDRNFLRMTAMMTAYLLLIFGGSGPMWIWEWAEEAGYDDRTAWGFVGIIFAIMIFVLCAIGTVMLRGVEKETVKSALKMKKEMAGKAKENLYKVWVQLLRLRNFRKAIIYTFLFAFGFVMLDSIFVYIMDNNAGMNLGQQAAFWVAYSLCCVAAMPVVTLFANKFGKRNVTIGFMIPALIASIYYYITGIHNAVDFFIYGLLWAVGACVFFMYYVAFAFDSIEVDEFHTGERKEGNVVAMSVFFFKAGSALGLFTSGITLELFGYDGVEAEQTERALQGILTAGALIPMIICLVALLVLSKYKITIQKYELLCAALEKKRAGKEYSTEGFEDILR